MRGEKGFVKHEICRIDLSFFTNYEKQRLLYFSYTNFISKIWKYRLSLIITNAAKSLVIIGNKTKVE